jgi:preprotein translocase subunit SecA
VSLQDELMKMFAGEWTIKVLGWLGMEEGMAIEDKRISKGILRAQKKVEERNYLARKNLLEYDEVMDHQRTIFYGMRQQVLEGRDVGQIIWDMIGDSIADAVDKYLGKDYVAAVVSEWSRINFDVTIDPHDLRGFRRLEDLEDYIKNQARAEAETNISATLVEFMGEDPESSADWDTKGLSSWAMSKYRVNVSQAQLRKMEYGELEDRIKEAAIEQIEKRDCAPLLKYLEPLYAETELAAWAREKFNIEVKPREFIEDESGPHGTVRKQLGDITALIEERARAAYAKRELEYPVDHVLTALYGSDNASTDDPYLAQPLHDWALVKYHVDLPLNHIRSTSVRKLREELTALQKEFMQGDKVEKEVDALIAANPDQNQLIRAFNERFFQRLNLKDLLGKQTESVDGAVDQVPMRDILIRKARSIFRQELTDLEQYVLISIFDTSWKDHLYAMDMLKTGIGLQAFAEQDPRVMYKKEGYEFFQQMMAGVRDKVTDLIFRARLAGPAEARNAYNATEAIHEETGNYGVAENLREIAAADPAHEQQQAHSGDGEAAVATKPIVRETPKVGRNDLCPCGSGKKYKKCCGANVA